MAIDRTGAGADAPARPKRSGGRSATAFLPREECRRRSPQAGEESWRRPLRFRRPRRSRPPSRLAHQRTHRKRPTRTGQDEGATAFHGAPPAVQTVTPAPASSREPTAVHHHRRRADHDRPFRPRTSPGKRSQRGPRPGQPYAPRTARWRVPLSARLPPYPIGRHATSLVEPAFNGRTNSAASTRTGAPRREAGRADPRSMEETRAERGDRTDMIMRMCLCAVGGGERVDHRRRPSLRRLMMSAFGPPPAPLRFVGWTTRSGRSREAWKKSRRPRGWRPRVIRATGASSTGRSASPGCRAFWPCRRGSG